MPPSLKTSTRLSQILSKIPNMRPKKSLINGLAIGHTTYEVATKIKLVTANTAVARNPPRRIAARAIIAVNAPNSTIILLDMEDATG